MTCVKFKYFCLGQVDRNDEAMLRYMLKNETFHVNTLPKQSTMKRRKSIARELIRRNIQDNAYDYNVK